jgi:Phage integrase, N-terminal SAM-like domain
MKDSPEQISPLRRRMIEDMRMRKLSTKTQESYIRAVRHFAGFLGRAHRLSIRPGQYPARTPHEAWRLGLVLGAAHRAAPASHLPSPQ